MCPKRKNSEIIGKFFPLRAPPFQPLLSQDDQKSAIVGRENQIFRKNHAENNSKFRPLQVNVSEHGVEYHLSLHKPVIRNRDLCGNHKTVRNNELSSVVISRALPAFDKYPTCS